MNDVFNWIQVTDETECPGIPDIYVDIGVIQNLITDANAKDVVHNILLVFKDASSISLLVLNQIPKGFDHSRFQN